METYIQYKVDYVYYILKSAVISGPLLYGYNLSPGVYILTPLHNRDQPAFNIYTGMPYFVQADDKWWLKR